MLFNDTPVRPGCTVVEQSGVVGYIKYIKMKNKDKSVCIGGGCGLGGELLNN